MGELKINKTAFIFIIVNNIKKYTKAVIARISI
jgi:hypothetical protein